MSPFLDNKTKEQIDLRLSLENPYETSSLKDTDISKDVFEQKLEKYRNKVSLMKLEPKELFKYLERKKLYLIKMLRGGERNQKIQDDSSSQKERVLGRRNSRVRSREFKFEQDDKVDEDLV